MFSRKSLDISRRGFLLSGAGAAVGAAQQASAAPITIAKGAHGQTSARPQANLKPEDRQFVEDYGKRCFRYFWEQWSDRTGLYMDRARMDGAPSSHAGSIAATGFGLTALCIGVERGWVPREQARTRVITTLRFLWGHSFHDHGWFLHFMDARSGQRSMDSEVSSIDTALLLAGVLTAQAYFQPDREIRQSGQTDFRAGRLRLDAERQSVSAVAWRDAGLRISEVALGLLQRSFDPLPARDRSAAQLVDARKLVRLVRPEVHYDNGSSSAAARCSRTSIRMPGSTSGIRWIRDGIDYFQNSQFATYAHRDFCISLQSRYSDYGPNMWGITVSDSAEGYVNWGGPPNLGPIDGTLVPCAAAGSLMFTPDICLPVLREMHTVYGDKIYQRYGFTDAFNPNWKDQKLWVNQDVIGIDVGISLLSIENLLTGNVWRWFMRNQYIQTAWSGLASGSQRRVSGFREMHTGARKS